MIDFLYCILYMLMLLDVLGIEVHFLSSSQDATYPVCLYEILLLYSATCTICTRICMASYMWN